jgi:hypothetical protein
MARFVAAARLRYYFASRAMPLKRRSVRCLLRTLLIAIVLFSASCASQGKCGAREWLARAEVSHPSSYSAIRKQYLASVRLDEMKTLPEAARQGVIAWIDGQIDRLKRQQQAGDELWYFNEEKCPRCGWYREGLALVRGCDVVDEITIKDDM